MGKRAFFGLGVVVLLVIGILGWMQRSNARSGHSGERAERSTDQRTAGAGVNDEIRDGEREGEPERMRSADPEAGGRTVRWPLLPGEFGVPAEGTRIELAPNFDASIYVPPAFGVIRDSFLVVENWRSFTLRALALGPNESIAWLSYEQGETVVGLPATFIRRGGVDLIVRRSDGEAAVGVTIGIGPSDVLSESPVRTAQTDANGYVQFRDMPIDALLSFSVLDLEPGWPPQWVGAADAGRVGAPPIYTIPEPVRVSMPVRVVGQVPMDQAKIRFGGQSLSTVSYDAATNSLVGIAWIPIQSHLRNLSVSVGGKLRGTVTVPVPPVENRWSMPISVHERGAEGTLTVVTDGISRAIAPNAGLAFRRHVSGNWHIEAKSSLRRVGRDLWRFLPGRIRLEIDGTSIVLGEAEVTTGNDSEIRFDAATVRTLECRADSAVDSDLQLTDMLISIGEGGAPIGLNEIPSGGGVFRCGVLATTKYTIHARGRMAAGRVGSATLRGVGGGVVPVRLNSLPTARITVPKALKRFDRVFLIPDAPNARAVECSTTQEGNRLRFSGYEPGRYWLALAAAIRAKGMLVTLSDRDIDLGRFKAAAGSTLVARVRTKTGFSPPSVFGSVQHVTGALGTFRGTSSREAPFSISGLMPGHYRVKLTCGPTGLHRLVWVDGRTDVELTIDLRHPD